MNSRNGPPALPLYRPDFSKLQCALRAKGGTNGVTIIPAPLYSVRMPAVSIWAYNIQ